MTILIENKTPWDTEALREFLSFLCENTDIHTVTVDLLRAHPGVKRIDQALFKVGGINFYAIEQNGTLPKTVKVSVISPKRSAARADLLDRLAQAGDLEPHETTLHPKIIGGIAHAFGKIKNLYSQARAGRRVLFSGNTWDYRKHYEGGCECNKTLTVPTTIKGNTKTRTAPPVDLARLKRRGRWALESAEMHRMKMEKQLALAQRLAKRIKEEEAKRFKAKGDKR